MVVVGNNDGRRTKMLAGSVMQPASVRGESYVDRRVREREGRSAWIAPEGGEEGSCVSEMGERERALGKPACLGGEGSGLRELGERERERARASRPPPVGEGVEGFVNGE